MVADLKKRKMRFQSVFLRPVQQKFACCVAGGRMCPPQECGGTSGYQRMLEIISNSKESECNSMDEWLGIMPQRNEN